MVFPIAGGTQDTGYEISNSLRFNEPDGAHLSRTPSSAGNRKTWTFSCWIKRSGLQAHVGDFQAFFTAGSGNDRDEFFWEASNGHFDKLSWFGNYGGTTYGVRTSSVFRDVSAWYHVVWVGDTTQGTEANRLKVYINGTQQTLTEFNSGFLSQNTDMYFNNTTEHEIGSYTGETQHFAGYMSEIHHIDGQALDPTYFAETNDNGVWIPKKYTGSYGTNGFFMEFKQTGTSANSSGMGADTSGNDHHFTPSNLAATDVTVDTPTNNFATLNPLQTRTYPTLAEGNLVQTGHSSSDSAGIGATIMPASGKWYVEAKVPNISSASEGYPHFGITDTSLLSTRGTQGTKIAAGFKINDAASVTNTNILGTTTLTNTNWPSWSDNDIINFALDLDNRKLYIGKNGTYINSGDPAAGSNHQITWANSTEISLILAGYSVSSGSGGGGDDTSWNYGNPAFSISSGNADANGYGNFEYAPPSGYYALCTKNLAEYG